MKVTLYHKATCNTCRAVRGALDNHGVRYYAVDYCSELIPRWKLKELMRKLGVRARDLLRRDEPMCRRFKLADKDISDDEIIEYIAQYPDLLRHPILEKGSRAVVAKSPQQIKRFL